MKRASLVTAPVFGALLRPAMVGGVSFEYWLMNCLISMMSFIVMGNPLYGLVSLPIHGLGWLMHRADASYFTILYLRLHLPISRNYAFWQAKSYAPY